MTMHAITLPEYAALNPEPEPPVPTIILPPLGSLPTKHSIRKLEIAISTFDGVPPLALMPHYHDAYRETFNCMYNDLEQARTIVIANDRNKIRNLGSYPLGKAGGIQISQASWRAPYGATLAFFSGIPSIRTSALLLRGSDGGRLQSFTLFTLRTLTHEGRDDGEKIETLVPLAYYAFTYTPGGDGGYEPNICADPQLRSRRDFLMVANVVVWLLERDRLKRGTAG